MEVDTQELDELSARALLGLPAYEEPQYSTTSPEAQQQQQPTISFAISPLPPIEKQQQQQQQQQQQDSLNNSPPLNSENVHIIANSKSTSDGEQSLYEEAARELLFGAVSLPKEGEDDLNTPTNTATRTERSNSNNNNNNNKPPSKSHSSPSSPAPTALRPSLTVHLHSQTHGTSSAPPTVTRSSSSSSSQKPSSPLLSADTDAKLKDKDKDLSTTQTVIPTRRSSISNQTSPRPLLSVSNNNNNNSNFSQKPFDSKTNTNSNWENTSESGSGVESVVDFEGDGVDVDTVDLSNLDITSTREEEFDFKEVGAILTSAQQSEGISAALQQGVDLALFTIDTDNQLREEEQGLVPLYFEARETIAEMHHAVTQSDAILAGFEELLTGYQGDLKAISLDLRALQSSSYAQHIMLQNRKAVSTPLRSLLDEITIPKTMSKVLQEGEVNELWVQYLSQLNKKVSFINSQKRAGIVACKDIEPRLKKMGSQAVEKIYKYLHTHFTSIRGLSYLRNLQQSLSGLSYLFQFLFKYAPNTANELKALYVEQCEKFYTIYFKNYVQSLSKMQLEVVTKNDLVGIDESKKGFFGAKLGKATTATTSVFTLGTRQQVFSELASPPINPPASATPLSALALTQDNTPKHNYPYLFRSMIHLLMDIITAEVFFVRDFFLSEEDVVNSIFLKCVEVLGENLNSYLSQSYDAIGLLIVLCLQCSYQVKMEDLHIPFLNPFLMKSITSTLSRYSQVFDMNVDSIKAVVPKDILGADQKGTSNYVTRRYAELVGSLLTVMKMVSLPENLHSGVDAGLARLRDALVRLLGKVSNEFKTRLESHAFLVNNYDLIMMIWVERDLPGVELEQIQLLLDRARKLFVEEHLFSLSFVANIARFLKEIEPVINSLGPNADFPSNHPKFNKDVVESLLKDFAQNWESGIEQMYTTTLTNLRNGMPTLRLELETFFHHYTSFDHIVLIYFKQLKSSKYFVEVKTIKSEIKKYTGFD